MLSSFHCLPNTINCMRLSRSFAISAKVIKELRDMTSAPMIDCKKALENSEVNGDLDKAVDYLRKQGMKKVNKVGSRSASQGVIASYVKDQKGILIELNSETDFVSRNDYFQKLAKDIAQTVFLSDKNTVEDVSQLSMHNQTVNDCIKEAIGKIGENIVLRKVSVIQAPKGSCLSIYTHNQFAPSLSQIASILSYSFVPKDKESSINTSTVEELAHQLAMHIVASNPMCTYTKDVPSNIIEKEKAIIMEQIPKNKPVALQEKMINGKLNNFYKQNVLVEQPFVLIEGSPVVKKYIDSFNKESKGKFVIDSFIRMQLGEKTI